MHTAIYFALRRGGAGQVRTISLRYRKHVARISPIRYMDGDRFRCSIDGVSRRLVDVDERALEARVMELIDRQEGRED
jgi:hypothetical protein